MKYLILIILFGFTQSVFSQDNINTKNSNIFLTKFKFKLLTGGVIIVNAKIENHQDTLNFVFYTFYLYLT